MVTKTTYRNREEWLSARSSTPVIGSSDVATIMGLNPYMTPYQYWRMQKGIDPNTEGNENTYRGQFKEDAIAKMFAQATGEKIIQKSAEITVYRNDKLPHFMQAAPDREIFAGSRGSRYVLECKDTKMYLRELDEETVPLMWYVQIQYQMGIMERDAAYIAAEEGSKNLVYALFPFNPKKFEHICTYCRDWFERYILGDEVPPIETGEDAKIAWPISQPETKEVDLSALELVTKIKAKREKLAKLKDEIDELEDQIKVLFEDKEAMQYDGAILATFKTVVSNRIDAKALKSEAPEIYAKYIKESTTRKLLLK